MISRKEFLKLGNSIEIQTCDVDGEVAVNREFFLIQLADKLGLKDPLPAITVTIPYDRIDPDLLRSLQGLEKRCCIRDEYQCCEEETRAAFDERFKSNAPELLKLGTVGSIDDYEWKSATVRFGSDFSESDRLDAINRMMTKYPGWEFMDSDYGIDSCTIRLRKLKVSVVGVD